MERNFYVQGRNLNSFDGLSILYQYHLDVADKTVSLDEFRRVLFRGGMRLTIQQLIQEAIFHFDMKFNIVSLLDKNGNILKYY